MAIPDGQQSQVLSTLLALEREARKAESQNELAYIMANDSHRLLPYAQGVVWSGWGKRARIEAISGVVKVDRQAIYLQALASAIPELYAADSGAVFAIDDRRLSEFLDVEFQAGHALLCRLDERSGLIFFREQPWLPHEHIVFESLVDAYAHAWQALDKTDHGFGQRVKQGLAKRSVQAAILITSLVVLSLPVRLSVLAPAEVVPSNPFLVSAPMQGVVENIVVAPNEAVQAGQVLFILDPTTLRNRFEVAKKTLEVARADYLRANQQAFNDPDAQAEVQFLQAKVAQQEAETAFTKTLLDKTKVRAERSGIAVFTDPDEWQGRPVNVGEKVMTLADPLEVEIQVWLPVADAVTMEEGSSMRLFLNTDPNNPINAVVYRNAYVAEIRPDQSVAFRLRARLQGQQSLPRIGLKGTAKLYGERVSLFYYLLRRPFAALRQFVGY